MQATSPSRSTCGCVKRMGGHEKPDPRLLQRRPQSQRCGQPAHQPVPGDDPGSGQGARVPATRARPALSGLRRQRTRARAVDVWRLRLRRLGQQTLPDRQHVGRHREGHRRGVRPRVDGGQRHAALHRCGRHRLHLQRRHRRVRADYGPGLSRRIHGRLHRRLFRLHRAQQPEVLGDGAARRHVCRSAGLRQRGRLPRQPRVADRRSPRGLAVRSDVCRGLVQRRAARLPAVAHPRRV